MRKVSLIGNSLAYLLCQTRQRATDYRPGMTPEDVRAVSEKSVRQHETTRAQVVRHQTRVSGLRDTNDTNSMTGDIPLIQRDRIVAAL